MITIQYNTIQYNTIQYNTIQYNTIQYNTIQYNTIQYITIQLYCPGLGNSFFAAFVIKIYNTGVEKDKNTDKFIIKTVC